VYQGSNGQHGVYTGASATVTNYPAPQAPPRSGQSTGSDKLEQLIEDKSLPDIKTRRAVAGYVCFPKASNDKHTDFELLYFGADGQVSLKLSPPAK
jgi:hypothetical protein